MHSVRRRTSVHDVFIVVREQGAPKRASRHGVRIAFEYSERVKRTYVMFSCCYSLRRDVASATIGLRRQVHVYSKCNF